jgi:hypothetical protein
MRSAIALVATLAWTSIAAAAPVEPKPIAPKPVETPEPAPEPGKPKPVRPKPAPRPGEPAPKQPKPPQPPLADPRPSEPKPGEPRPTEPKPTATTPAKLDLAPKIDLTPSHLFGPQGAMNVGATRNAKPPEHHGATLGDDTSWKVQAAQVGVMVGAFGVLSVLCGSGRCAEALGDVVPGGRPEQGPQVDVNRGSGSSLRDAR